MNKTTRLFNLFIIAALFLGACNLPSNNPEDASATAAAQTVEALLSATPAFTETATPTPIDTITPISSPVFTSTAAASATPICNLAEFRSDVTVPDGSVMTPGQTFTKKWRIRNIGVCAWNGYNLVFDSGEAMSGPASKAIPTVNPGQEVDLEVNLTAPNTPGNYRGYWRIVTGGNVLVPVVNGYQGRAFYVDIKVPAATPTPTPTATNTSIPFTVTSVSFTNIGGCGGFTATANITTNGPGTVTYTWKFSDGASVANATISFAAAGTQSVSYTWNTTAVSSPPDHHWIDIYIVSPNNQQFGRASFVCP